MLLKPLNPDSGGRIEHSIVATWPGFVAKTSRRKTDYSISYASQPSEHYIALHHFSRREGETRIDGLPGSSLTDLRGKLTQIPSGCGAQGWTAGASNEGHVTMMFFDPGQLTSELGRMYATSSVRPKLYFEDADLIADAMTRLDRVLAEGDRADRSLCRVDRPVHRRAGAGAVAARPGAGARARVGSRSRMAILDDYLRAHIGNPVSIDDLAQLAGPLPLPPDPLVPRRLRRDALPVFPAAEDERGAAAADRDAPARGPGGDEGRLFQQHPVREDVPRHGRRHARQHPPALSGLSRTAGRR
jgi:AraC family transcriptional regulator